MDQDDWNELKDRFFDHDPGSCPECKKKLEWVRPGKSQPTCDCQDKCPTCGTMRRHFAFGELRERIAGFLCPKCDAYSNGGEGA
jgi:hypothetical protein